MMKKFHKKCVWVCQLLLLTCGVGAKQNVEDGLYGVSYDGPYDEAIINGTIHVLAQQCDDGGWGWPHNECSSSAYNITSAIVDGLFRAFEISGLSVIKNAAVAAGDFNLTSVYSGTGDARLGSQTALNLWELSAMTGDQTYNNWVKSGFYEALLAGTYGANEDWDVDDFIDKVRNPPGPWINLRPWEFSYQALAAERYCYPSIAEKFETAILDSLATLDNTDSENVYFDVLGLAGGVLGLARVNRLTFPEIFAAKHAAVNGESTLVGLANALADFQNANGSFYWHSNLTEPATGDEDTQTTAYAILALIEAQQRLPEENYLPAIQMGKEWLLTQQDDDGGFFSNPGGTHNIEVEAEAIHALGKVGVYDRIYRGQMECYVN